MAENSANPSPELAEYLKTINRLEEVYRNHFPSNRLDCGWEAYWIHHTVWSMPWPAWKHDDVLGELENLRRALQVLSRFNDLPQAVTDAFNIEAFQRSKEDQREITPTKAALVLPDLYDLLAPSIKAAILAASDGDEGKTDWTAVNAIDACRISWWRCTGEEAPISINEASPFGRFAQDIFDALDIKRNGRVATARAAIDAWRRIQRSDEES